MREFLVAMIVIIGILSIVWSIYFFTTYPVKTPEQLYWKAYSGCIIDAISNRGENDREFDLIECDKIRKP